MDIPLPPSPGKAEYSPSQVTSPQSDDGFNSKSSSPKPIKKAIGLQKAGSMLKFLKMSKSSYGSSKKSKNSEDNEDTQSQEDANERILFETFERAERQAAVREREKKLNIESIIEEETNEKKMIPKMDAMPNKAGSSYNRMLNAAGPVEVDILNRQRAEEEALKRAAQYQITNIKCDNFGFVTAQVQQPIVTTGMLECH